jgi:hypothetical protein
LSRCLLAFKLFGFTLLSPKEVSKQDGKNPSVIPPQNTDGATTVYEGGIGVFGQYAINFNDYSSYASEVDLVNQYRDLALQPEVDEAINDIIHEMVIKDEDQHPVAINLDALPKIYNDSFRELVQKEFDAVLVMLDFKNKCYDIARQFYVDGRLYYDMIIDESRVDRGIVELRNIDPRTIKPVREMRETIHNVTGAKLTDVIDEYYLFNPDGIRNVGGLGAVTSAAQSTGGVRMSKDRVAYINSGIFTPGNVQVLSHLHKAIKPYNQLRMVEDATVIYRVTRAPERRVFYIDVGDLPTAKAEQYLQSVATQYRNRVTYDSVTGQVRDDRKFQSMLEDFFLPRRTGGKGTEVTNLPGGQHLGEMEDVEYFKRKLYRALGIPVSRIEKDGGQFNLGRSAEISRDEIRFSRFLVRLRDRLATLFDEILSRHLTLRGIIRSNQQWGELRQFIKYDYVIDSHFTELKELELLGLRLEAVQKMEPYIGKYFSEQYIRDHVLKQPEEHQEEIEQDIAEDPKQKSSIQKVDAFGNPIEPGANPFGGPKPPGGGKGSGPAFQSLYGQSKPAAKDEPQDEDDVSDVTIADQ